jgi:Na+/melibiose symporter-like transporter
MDEPGRRAPREIVDLEHRRKLASWSINFCAGAALLVCIVIVTLFVEEFFSANLKWVAGVLFVGAMFALIGGLFSFLREVYLATHMLRIDIDRFDHSDNA